MGLDFNIYRHFEGERFRGSATAYIYIIFLSLLSLLLFFLIDHVVYERLVRTAAGGLSALPGIDSVTVSGRGDLCA